MTKKQSIKLKAKNNWQEEPLEKQSKEKMHK